MKKIIIIIALLLFVSCEKETITPKPPTPPVVEPLFSLVIENCVPNFQDTTVKLDYTLKRKLSYNHGIITGYTKDVNINNAMRTDINFMNLTDKTYRVRFSTATMQSGYYFSKAFAIVDSVVYLSEAYKWLN